MDHAIQSQGSGSGGSGELKLLLTFRGIDTLIRDTSEIVVETLLLGDFQVAQHGSTGVKGKAVAFHVPERHKIERHFPAMQVAVYTEIGKRKFTGSNVVIGIHVKPPVWGQGQTAPEVDGLGDPSLHIRVGS